MNATQTHCAHCGLPLNAPIESPEPAFCCVGCEAVYHALHGEGFETFYALRSATDACPVPVAQAPSTQGNAHDVFDQEDFLERHSREVGPGEREIDLYLDGVHCAGCVWLVERLPFELSGVLEARLDLPRARLRVRWRQDMRPLSEVARWLARFGYSAHPLRGQGVSQRSSAERSLLIRVGICWALAGNVMLLASAFYAGLDMGRDGGLATGALWASLVLSGLSVAIGGRTFLSRAWASLKAAVSTRGKGLLTLSMDVPISVGIVVGWCHSAWTAWGGGTEVWFDSVSVLIAALLTARWLQMRGRRAAGDASDRLLSLLPTMARRVGEDDQVQEVDAGLLEPGDVVEVRAGEVFPADGLIVRGQSLVHRGVLTGESVPEVVAAGVRVHAGATNVGSVLRVEVAASGAQTRVGQLLAWIEERGQNRAPVVQMADRWSGVFVAAVLLAAAVTYGAWSLLDPQHAVAHTVALLVISCPCALGMATPLALTVATGRAAQRGIFIKHDDVIEALTQATHVILDKTGTLTQGRMSVVEVVGDEDALALAAALESASQHPVAQALRRHIQTDLCSPQDVREEPGAGMSGTVDGQAVLVGRPDWVFAQVGDQARWCQTLADVAGHRALTPVVVAVDGTIKAMVGFGDPLRPEATGLIEALRRRGVHPVLLSGDHPDVVQATGRHLGLDAQDVHGGVTPETKRAFVTELQSHPGHTVVMVGDGVNDAAALQAAAVGVAVHGGAEVSLVASDIFIARPGLEAIAALFEGADQAMGVIRRNMAISVLYNALGVTLAAMGMVGPLLAAVAMPISSLAVVASSLLQRQFGAPLQRPTNAQQMRNTPPKNAIFAHNKV